MAYYSESGGYCAEDVRRPYAEPGYRYGEGGERYAIRKEYEEVDEVARAGRGHYGHGHGHLGHSASGHHHHHGHLGGEQHRVHGHGGGATTTRARAGVTTTRAPASTTAERATTVEVNSGLPAES
ncbi:hypothetical protein HU200_054273 [Digitaria exilis]|uniref:Uncharacterized protein n=1 Tax=Digitaria exilis TaxID=1010633 RepID=A0A835E7U0_9POAL|nr:hypothetical protein HU200_054273 [Digitaria exilis]